MPEGSDDGSFFHRKVFRMNGLPYYKAYPRDFIEGTIGMPFEVKCAYRVVLDLIYMQGGNLPDDARYISGLLGCSLRKWKSIRAALIEMGKIQVSGEFLTNYRAEKELETLAKLQDKQRENASGPRKNNNLKKPRPDHTEPEPEPDVEIGKPISCSFADFWSVWPSKIAKGAAEKAWRKLSHDDRIAARDFAANGWFARWQASKPDANPIHPATYLNGKRWNDELPQPKEMSNGRNDRNSDGAASARAERVAERWAAKQAQSGVDFGPGGDASQPLLSAPKPH